MKEVVFRSQRELIYESIKLEIRSFQLYQQQATKTFKLTDKNHWEQLSRDAIRHKVLLKEILLDTFENTTENMAPFNEITFDKIQSPQKISKNNDFLLEVINNKLKSIALYKQLLAKTADNKAYKIISKIIFDEEHHLEFLQKKLNHPTFSIER